MCLSTRERGPAFRSSSPHTPLITQGAMHNKTLEETCCLRKTNHPSSPKPIHFPNCYHLNISEISKIFINANSFPL